MPQAPSSESREIVTGDNYTQHYPGAEQDIDAARAMAQAPGSGDTEMLVDGFKRDLLEASRRLSGSTDPEERWQAVDDAKNAVENAARARLKANGIQEDARVAYKATGEIAAQPNPDHLEDTAKAHYETTAHKMEGAIEDMRHIDKIQIVERKPTDRHPFYGRGDL